MKTRTRATRIVMRSKNREAPEDWMRLKPAGDNLKRARDYLKRAGDDLKRARDNLTRQIAGLSIDGQNLWYGRRRARRS